MLFFKNELQRCQDECSRSLADVRESAAKGRHAVEEELAQTERSHRARIAELEHQFQKQRDRSLALLQEKDEELANLRHLLFEVRDGSPPTADNGGNTSATRSAEPWPDSIAPLASMTLGITTLSKP